MYCVLHVQEEFIEENGYSAADPRDQTHQDRLVVCKPLISLVFTYFDKLSIDFVM